MQNAIQKKAAAIPPSSFFNVPSAPPLHQGYLPHTAAYTAPTEYAALAAEASELRRRSAQTALDKCRARCTVYSAHTLSSSD